MSYKKIITRLFCYLLCCLLLVPQTSIATSYNHNFSIRCYSSPDEKQLDRQLKDNEEKIAELLEPIMYYFNNVEPYMNISGFKGLYRINTYKNNSFEYMVKDIMNRNGIESIYYADMVNIIKIYEKLFTPAPRIPKKLAGPVFFQT